MAVEPKRSGYNRTQIILHWTIAVLIVLQLINSRWMEPAFESRVGEAPVGEAGNPWPHIAIGVCVLLLVIWRLTVRLRRGAPAHAAGENSLISTAAKANHVALYVLLFAMPLTGAIAWFGALENVGDIHSVLRWVLIVLVVLHIAGGLFEQFVLRNNVLMRIVRPQH